MPDARVVRCDPLTAGSCNTNYKVEVDRSPHLLVLRVVTHNPHTFRKQLALMRRVQASVPVPAILFSAESHPLIPFPCMWLEFVQGESLETLLPSQSAGGQFAIGHAIGQTLARIGNHRFDRSGFLDDSLTVGEPFKSFSGAVLSRIEGALFHGRAGGRLGEITVERVWRLLLENRCHLEALPETRALVHGDFHSKNVLLAQGANGWDVSGVLDWEFAYAGSPLSDLGNLLCYFETPPPAFEEGVVRGFTRCGGVLPSWWRRAVRLLDLVTVCDFLDKPVERAREFANAKLQLHRTLYGLDRLA